ncbi:hypothetical protein POL68_09555 [Stigmatella sp. ncwal1]|uniref:YD repeat-containing protein n=1 Tax=Stigmatella ashevillensis TaxID=2995309 RepID=A0ABT5D4X5_9BACT|nr:hypothetical protein [Stigmatella ashevillena]MDC0708713.1 hypothetical protein [Stigmatella ashevillena]
MRQYQGWVGWGLCAVLAGCGAQREEPPAPETPEQQQPPEEVPSVPSEPVTGDTPTGQPPPAPPETPPAAPSIPPAQPAVPRAEPLPSPGNVPPVSAGLEGAPTLSPVACVPWTGRVPPRRATACEGVSVYKDGRRAVGRYDADSRLLEWRTYKPDGTPDSVEHHSWVNGRETFRRIEENLPEGTWTQIEWVYDAAGKPQERTETSSSAPNDITVYRYVRNTKGRLERIDRLPASEEHTPVFYRYNPAGQLVAIDSSPHCDMNVARCETFTYWPNGKLREDAWDNDDIQRITHRYDERGYLVDELEYAFESNRHTVHSYGPGGREFRLWEQKAVNVYEHELIRTFYHDASGLLLLERLGKDVTQPSGNDPSAPPVTTRMRTTRRLTYLCGTQIVWLDEWDGNGDGVVDARRTHERDAQGRLVHEAYSGTPGLDEGPVRRDFKYECD